MNKYNLTCNGQVVAQDVTEEQARFIIRFYDDSQLFELHSKTSIVCIQLEESV